MGELEKIYNFTTVFPHYLLKLNHIKPRILKSVEFLPEE